MDTVSRCSTVWIFTVFEIVALVLSTPVWSPQSSTEFGRNIRHLPCVSRRTGETGVCMFAFSCAKANGTHLGTCIDRFYFGSCCKLSLQSEDVAEPLDSNHILEEFPPSVSTENYQLSTYQSVQIVKNTTDKPAVQSTTTPRTTPSQPITAKPTKKPTTTRKPSITVSPSVYTHKPITSSKPLVTKPYTQSSTTKPRPSSKPTQKPLSSSKPSLVSKPSTNTTFSTKPSVKPPSKPVVSTKPKPSNTTTYTKPSVKPGPQKPTNGTVTKPAKPVPTKRPITTSTTKPSQIHTSKPAGSTSKPTSKPTHKPQTKPTTAKPQTKPPLKPIPVVTSVPPTGPNYVKVPVVTMPSSANLSTESTTISNEVIQKPTTTLSTNSSLESEEESSNVINESPPIATTSSTLLVTWTTVDEVPVPPLPKPVSTPSSGSIKNETKPSTTAPTQPSQTWVQVSMSTPVQTTDSTKPDTSPAATSTQKPATATSVATTTTGATTLTESTTTSTTTTAEPITEPSVNLGNTTETASEETALNTTTTGLLHNEIPTNNLNMSDYLDVCGRRLFPQSRIVGGDKATFGKWPWQISLRQWRTSTYLHKCGAALLNENWAITAAHCVENVAPSDLLLRLGEHDLSLEDEPYGYQERRVQIVASHPQFDPRTFEYDLALLRFYEPVSFQPNIIPVCVPQDDTNFVASTAYVTGWGRLYEDGPLPSVLQEVSVPVINNTVCETMYRAAGYIEHIPEIFICAGWKKGGFDSCEGDSGGPMVIQRPDKRWLLAGVISWGIGCAEPNQPGVYTRISEFRGWINQILQF